MVPALVAMLLVAAGCSDDGDYGSVVAGQQAAGNTKPATGPLKMSLSRGLDEEVADVPVGATYSVRFTVRNGTAGPAAMAGVQLEQVEGDLRFVDALAGARAKGLDREARVFKDWPPDPDDVGMDQIDQFSTSTIPANGAIDVLVAFQLGSVEVGRFSGITVVYTAGGVTYRPTFDIAVALCRGDFVDGDDCAGESQLDQLIDLKGPGNDADPSNDADPAN